MNQKEINKILSDGHTYQNMLKSESGSECICYATDAGRNLILFITGKDVQIMEKFTGRPSDMSGRLPREVRVYDTLDRLGISYTGVDHRDIPAATMEDCLKIDELLGVTMCKNLFLMNRQQTMFYLLLMPGDKPFKTKEISSQIGSARLSFATPEYMLKYLDIEPGAVSLMGLMNDTDHAVRLLVDEDLLSSEYLGCHPCVNTASIRLRSEEAFHTFIEATGHSMTTVKLIGE